MPRSAWEAVLFDVEGVIAHRDDALAERALRERWPDLTVTRVQAVRHEATLYAYWEDYSRGWVEPDAYWGAVLVALDLPATAEAVAGMRSVQEATAWAVLDDAVLAIVRRLRATGSLRLGLLSNSAPDYEAHIARFEPLFDVACFSHRTGRRKPDPAAYLGAAAALGVPPEAVVFVDDRSRNLGPAEVCGMRALAFTDAAALDRDLAALGLPAA